jgi:hypothetical protein
MQTKTPETASTKYHLKNVRLSYPSLHVAKAGMEGGKAQYQANLLLDKTAHAKDIEALRKLIDRVALDKFGKKVTLKHVCLRDGADLEDKEGYGEDVMFIVAKSEDPVPVVDGNKIAIPHELIKSKCYGGCYVNAIVRLYAWSHPTGGKGVSAGLGAIQFVRDGDSFGAGRVNPDEEFETVEAEDDDV